MSTTHKMVESAKKAKDKQGQRPEADRLKQGIRGDDTHKTPKVEKAAPAKEESQDSKDRRKRREISTFVPSDLGKTNKTPHPFGVRNRHLIAARKLMRAGKRAEADKQIAEAEHLAPLSGLEREAINRAMRVAWPTPPKNQN